MSTVVSSSDIARHDSPTIEAVRNALLNGRILLHKLVDADEFVEYILNNLTGATQQGRLFDFGHLSRQVIIPETQYAIPLYLAGHIGHPFREPYVFFFNFEGQGRVYLVDPTTNWLRSRKGPNANLGPYGDGAFIIGEALCAKTRSSRDLHLVLADVGICRLIDEDNFFGLLIIEQPNREHINEWLKTSALLNPVLALQLLLATDGVAAERIQGPAKLNKARAKSGKAPIPPHWRIKTGPYITALLNRQKRYGEPGGGHHASPIPHLRRGHLRHLHERHGGGTTWVRDALIMLKNGQEMTTTFGRAFYQVASMPSNTTPT